MTDEGIVIRGHGKSFIVKCQGKKIPCEIRGKIKYQTDSVTPVAVGDDVSISVNPDGTGMIETVHKRRTMFLRPLKGSDSKKQVIAANIDQMAIIASVKSPPLKTGLIDRFLISARIGSLRPLVIINKIDLGKPPILDEIEKGYTGINIPAFQISAVNGEGIENLKERLREHRTIFVGHSGVGKTTILNNIIPGLDQKVKEISKYSDRGTHATTLVQLFELPTGGFVVDSPGLKVLGLWEVKKEQLDQYFPEMIPLIDNCRFHGCSHTHEPDCAVKEAVENKIIPEFRYKSYKTIYKSL